MVDRQGPQLLHPHQLSASCILLAGHSWAIICTLHNVPGGMFAGLQAPCGASAVQ